MEIRLDESDFVEARESMFGCFVFDPDVRLVRTVIKKNMLLAAKAYQWSWSDTEVREELAVAISEELIGSKYNCYDHSDEQDLALKDAYVKWLAALSNEVD